MILREAFHSISNRRMIEVFDNDMTFVAAIYPDDENNAIKIVSKYFCEDRAVIYDVSGRMSEPHVPAVIVKFRRKE